MEALDHARNNLLSIIIRDTPVEFWRESRIRVRQLYQEIFHEVAAYRNLIEVQRLEKLAQDRYFRMEWLFHRMAETYGFASTPTALVENNHHFVFATKGAVGLTQTYVPAIGDMPQPARFRERLARMNDLPKYPRLELGDEPKEVFLLKEFYGLLVHNPVGKRFVEADQRLGMMQLCVPIKDCSRWGLQMGIDEIISAYDSVTKKEDATRSLPWKSGDKSKRGGEE